MPDIRIIPPSRATGETADAYRLMKRVGGSGLTSNIVQLFSLRPHSMRRMIRSWEFEMWCGLLEKNH